MVRDVDLLGDKRSQLDSQSDEQEQPVEEDNPVRVTQPRVFEPLYRKYYGKGRYSEGSRPYPEVAEPYVRVADDLDDELGDEVGDNEGKKTLSCTTLLALSSSLNST